MNSPAIDIEQRANECRPLLILNNGRMNLPAIDIEQRANEFARY